MRGKVKDARGTERLVDVGGTLNGSERGDGIGFPHGKAKRRVGDDRNTSMRRGRTLPKFSQDTKDGANVTSLVVSNCQGSLARGPSGDSAKCRACCFQARSAAASRDCLAAAASFATKVSGVVRAAKNASICAVS